jgi:ligand-binding sensor domain-containing protein/two-component sensor histidine kinase
MKFIEQTNLVCKISFVVFLAGLFWGNIGVAQHLGHKRFTVEDGLAQSEIVALFQDSKGFIWSGTKFGISRFDGNLFVTRYDSLGILKSAVRYINELADGSVIASSTLGYVLFLPDGSMQAFKFPGFNPDAYHLSWVFNGKSFVATSLPNKTEVFECTHHGPVNVTDTFKILTNALNGRDILAFLYNKKNNCYYFTDKAQNSYWYSNGKVERLDLPVFQVFQNGLDGNMYSISTIPTKNTSSESRQRLIPNYVLNQQQGTNHRICRLDGKKIITLFDFATDKPCGIHYFNVSKSGKIVIPLSGNGKILYSYNGKRTLANLDFYSVSAFCLDDEGTPWLGTANGLIHVFPEYFVNFNANEGLFPDIQSVVTDMDGKIWAASYENGLQFYENGRFVKKNLFSSSGTNLPSYFFPGSRADHLGRPHFCNNPQFALIWDGNKIIKNTKDPLVATFYFYDDTISRCFYYGSDSGLVVQDYNLAKYKIYPAFPGPSTRSKVVSIVRAANGELLLGGFKALLVYSPETFVKLANHQLTAIPGANAMEMDYKKNIWIGNGDGVFFYNNKTFKKIKNEYFNDLVLSLQCIDSTKLLIGGIKGIGVLDLNVFYKNGDIKIKYFDKNNGFTGGECQQNCTTLDKEGFCWIGASNGIVRLDVKAIPDNNQEPRVYLTEVDIYNQRMDWFPVSNSTFGRGEIKLSHNNNNIRFEFTGISFSASEAIKFSYKLEGFDNHWSEPNSDRDVAYTNLPPGKYLFKVRASKDAGIWSENSAEYSVTVVASLWQRWYFYLFVVVLIAGLITVGVSHFLARRNRIINDRNEAERRFAELQLKTLRNQLEPHFIFNALNAIGSSIFQNEKEKSYDYLQRFAVLIRSTLLHADKIYRTLKEEIDFVKNYLDLEQFRFEDKFRYEIKINDDTNLETLVPKMIIQTFAENAIKHGLVKRKEEGILLIEINSDESYINISVNDNGIGRSEAQRIETNSTGMGQVIIKEFISLLNRFNENKIYLQISDKLDENKKVAGTLVTIKLPNNISFNSIPKTQ